MLTIDGNDVTAAEYKDYAEIFFHNSFALDAVESSNADEEEHVIARGAFEDALRQMAEQRRRVTVLMAQYLAQQSRLTVLHKYLDSLRG